MAQIALNKPSGGQMLLVPEDGTSTETVTIPTAGFSGGKVLQVQRKDIGIYNLYTSTTTLSGLPYADTTFTPLKADSQLLVQAFIQWDTDNSNYDGLGMAIFRDSVNQHAAYPYGFGAFEYGGNNNDEYRKSELSVLVPANSTNATYFQIYARTWSGNSIKYYGHAGVSHITIWEIAA